jgi:hypothetical protein
LDRGKYGSYYVNPVPKASEESSIPVSNMTAAAFLFVLGLNISVFYKNLERGQ